MNHPNLGQKKLVEINDDTRQTYNNKSKIKLKTTRLKSSLCDYSDVQILVNGTLTITGKGANDARNEQGIFKYCAPFMDCIGEIKNAQLDNAKDFDVVILMYNLIETSDNY